jgi:hypothetical protein
MLPAVKMTGKPRIRELTKARPGFPGKVNAESFDERSRLVSNSAANVGRLFHHGTAQARHGVRRKEEVRS